MLIYASATPDEVEAAQARLGRERAGSLVEDALAEIAARRWSPRASRRLVVAGGETSGAVVQALGSRALRSGR